MVNIAHGDADIKLMPQIFKMVFLAFPGEDIAREEKGRHMAKYLKYVNTFPHDFYQYQQETDRSTVKAIMVRMEAYVMAS